MKKPFIFSLLLMICGAVQAAERLEVAPVQYREVEQTYSVEGLVEATRQSTVSAQISGRIKEINFDVGSRVKKGQVILRIDERETARPLTEEKRRTAAVGETCVGAKQEHEAWLLIVIGRGNMYITAAGRA